MAVSEGIMPDSEEEPMVVLRKENITLTMTREYVALETEEQIVRIPKSQYDKIRKAMKTSEGFERPNDDFVVLESVEIVNKEKE